jgi:hypothetical protein
MYFCEYYIISLDYQGTNIKIGFIAFTTIGYGDLAPETAIGRSIFVFWALFGVGAMTVLFAGTFSELRSPLVTFSIPQSYPMPSLRSITVSHTIKGLIVLSIDIVRARINL